MKTVILSEQSSLWKGFYVSFPEPYKCARVIKLVRDLNSSPDPNSVIHRAPSFQSFASPIQSATTVRMLIWLKYSQLGTVVTCIFPP